MELVYFKRTSEIDRLIENIEEVLKDEEKVEVYASAGSKEHWLNSLEMCLKTRGYIIWGQRLDVEDLAQLFKERRRSGGRSSVQRPFFDNYFTKPIINLFYVNDVGFIGAGLITMLIMDKYNLFWHEELTENKVIFPLRWISKAFWLKREVLENPRNTNKWKGEIVEGVPPPRSGLQRISRDKSKVLKFLLGKLEEINYTMKALKEITIEKTKPRLTLDQVVDLIKKELYIDEETIKLLFTSTDLGNVILVGPPGTGKTVLAKMICKLKGYEPITVVANAHWSRFDVIGGLTLGDKGVVWKSGCLIRALVKHFENRETSNLFRGAWLIIDEINRADVDKAFSEFFTIFSSTNPKEWVIPSTLIDEINEYVSQGKADVFAKRFLEYLDKFKGELYRDGEYYIPGDFRVIATMNYIDVRNLFLIGEAFARRFFKVEISYPSNIDEELKFLLNKVAVMLSNKISNEIIKEYTKEFNELLPKVSSFIKESRNLRISLGSAMILQALCLSLMEYAKAKKDVLKSLKDAFISVSPMSKYWDEELKVAFDNLIKNYFG